MATVTDLAAAIRAAIDETEQDARSAWQENWRWYAEDKTVMTHVDQSGEWDGYRVTGTRADAQHIARHDPAAVLRRVAADRKILELHAGSGDVCDAHDASYETVDCETVLALADAYGIETRG